MTSCAKCACSADVSALHEFWDGRTYCEICLEDTCAGLVHYLAEHPVLEEGITRYKQTPLTQPKDRLAKFLLVVAGLGMLWTILRGDAAGPQYDYYFWTLLFWCDFTYLMFRRNHLQMEPGTISLHKGVIRGAVAVDVPFAECRLHQHYCASAIKEPVQLLPLVWTKSWPFRVYRFAVGHTRAKRILWLAAASLRGIPTTNGPPLDAHLRRMAVIDDEDEASKTALSKV